MTMFTTVDILFVEKRVQRWIRFGSVAHREIINPQRRIVAFTPGSVFAFIRWRGNEHGTTESRIDILRAVADEQSYSTVPFVRPGGESLLKLSGWPKVANVLALIDAIESKGINPATVCPDYWRHVMNRLCGKDMPRAYTTARHAAWIRRRGAGVT